MIPLYLLTPVSRPENLTKIETSIAEVLAPFMREWFVVRDDGTFPIPRKSRFPDIDGYCNYGKPLLNKMLDCLQENQLNGMVGFLDDDTILPESFADAYTEFLKHFPAKKAFTVQQANKDGTMRLDVRTARRGAIDQGCYFIHTDLIGSHRFYSVPDGCPRRYYRADREFYHQVRGATDDLWVDLPIVGSIYNALR